MNIEHVNWDLVLGKTTACATCALCWQSKRRIAFIQH
jgi:hypothetical protein